MKKVLLTSTALVMTAGVAAAEMSMSASAKLSYGNFGTGLTASGSAVAGGTVPDAAWSSTADLTVSGSGGGGSLSYSASLEIDEGGDGLDAGAFTLSTGGLTFVYDDNDVGGIATTATTADATSGAAGGTAVGADVDGEDNTHGDYKISYAAGGLSGSYTVDNDTDDTEMTLGYASGALTVGLAMLDECDNLAGAAGCDKTTTSVGYVMGDATVKLSADDNDDWDASVAYVSGGTTMTVATDETNMYSAGLSYTSGDMTFSARQEFNNPAGTVDETEFGLSYKAGDMTFGATYDSGQENHFGDEAQTVINASYAMDGVTFAGKATDQDEVEISMSFAF